MNNSDMTGAMPMFETPMAPRSWIFISIECQFWDRALINKLNILPSSALNVLRTFNFSSKENVVARKPVLFLMSIIEDDANRLDRIMHSGLVFRHSSRNDKLYLIMFCGNANWILPLDINSSKCCFGIFKWSKKSLSCPMSGYDITTRS